MTNTNNSHVPILPRFYIVPYKKPQQLKHFDNTFQSHHKHQRFSAGSIWEGFDPSLNPPAFLVNGIWTSQNMLMFKYRVNAIKV